jgi:hypothetical protein
MATKLRFGTKERIDYRTGKHVIIRRSAMSYDRLMQACDEMQRTFADFQRQQTLMHREVEGD